ncbi:MAG: hypothetical protein ACP5KN_03915 [Armatimonadota bacterium]
MRSPLLSVALTLAMAIPAMAQPYIGDYDAELRDGEHVDVELMVERLQELGANTYMWLIWHSPNDWEDLHAFLPLAREAGITVWVYLVPPSETSAVHPERGFPYSEPFRLDYVRWAEEIARLSLEQESLVGYVIDDFWGNVNPQWFTPEYIQRMVEAGRAINPNLRFYALMYPSYGQIGPEFAQMMGPIIDGVVAAYPRDRAAILDALPYLNDSYHLPARCTVSYPGWTPSEAGDFGFAEQTARVTDPSKARLSFRYSDDFAGPTSGYHFMQLRVNGDVVWEQDVAGGDDGAVTLNLSRHARGRVKLQIAFGVADRRGVSQFGVTASFFDLHADGLRLQGFDSPDVWRTHRKGRFSIEMQPGYRGSGRFHLPVIVMPAGQRGEYEHRWGEEATAERIAARVRMGLQLVREGKAEGVVTYCLDKTPGSEDFEAVRAAFDAFHSGEPLTD